MKIGLTGASGFIGRHFIPAATAAGHEVIGFSRQPKAGQRDMNAPDVSGIDALIHLAGENVFGVWTRGRKRRIRDSRVEGTRRLVDAMLQSTSAPRVFLCASGVAWYGNGGDAVLDESTPPGRGFMAEVAQAWEVEAHRADSISHVACLRMGMVLGKDGGAFKLLRRVYRLFLGGKLGNGRQWMAWIHVTDVCALMLHVLEHALKGPVNVSAPEPVTNQEFTRNLAKAFHRPAILPAPAFALKMLPGGMASLFLDSLRVVPKVALDSGFQFRFPTFESALHDLCP